MQIEDKDQEIRTVKPFYFKNEIDEMIKDYKYKYRFDTYIIDEDENIILGYN